MSIEEKMNELKKPKGMEGFGTEEARDLQHAMDILNELRLEVTGASGPGGSMTAWEKLKHAKDYLDKILEKHITEESESK